MLGKNGSVVDARGVLYIHLDMYCGTLMIYFLPLNI